MNQEESGVYPKIEGYARNLSWGTHICQLYQSKQDLMDIVVPYITAGLQNNQRCIWFTPQILGFEEANEALRKTVPNLEEYANKNQIEINPQRALCSFSKIIDINKILQEFSAQEKFSFDQGFSGLRLAGNVTPIKDSVNPKLWASSSTYEAAINDHIASRKIIVLCTSPLEKCISNDVPEIESHHTGTLIKGNNKWIFLQSVNHIEKAQQGTGNLPTASPTALLL